MKVVAYRLILPLALLAGVLFSVLPTEAAPGCKKQDPTACPQIVAPVNCTKGNGNQTVTYINQCVADANCARNCVPAG